MRWTTWTLFFAALALLVGVAAMVSRQSLVTPEDFFADVEKRIADGRYDRQQTILNLDQVLERARQAGNADLETRVLRRRGRLSMELGAWDRARNDLLAVAEAHPDEPEVESDLIELETQAGDFAAAEARVRRVLARAPDSPESWAMLGRLHRLAGEKNESSAIELLRRTLTPEDLTAAERYIHRAVALDPADLSRPALADRVRQLLRETDEQVLQQVLRFIDRATDENVAARDGFARALEIRIQPKPLAELTALFAQAGRDDLTIDLSTIALRQAAVRNDVDVARGMLAALERRGRFKFAIDVSRPWVEAPVDSEFLARLARIALAAENWRAMARAGTQLLGVGTADFAAAGHFFRGIALVHLGDFTNSRLELRRFVLSPAPDPVPGARAMSWRAIAQASRELGQAESEREALQGAIDLDPDHDGDQHLRLAELLMIAPHGGYRIPETHYAKGMSLLPERTEQLMPRWREIGQSELKSIGLDPEVVRADLLRNRVWTPATDSSPYELFRLAQIHHEAHDEPRAKAHLDRLLERVPGFLPALDLAIEVAQTQTNPRPLLAAVTRRVAVGGRTPKTSEVLRTVPLDELVSTDVHDLMRSDPEYFGRIAAATTLARQGRLRSALAVIETIASDNLGDEARVLSARLDLEAGRPARAFQLLEPMGRALIAAPDALVMAARAACWSETPANARPLLEMATRNREVGRARRLVLADLALDAGEFAAAREVLRAIDSRPIARGGDLCTRLAIAATGVGDAADARRMLARAEAFETMGSRERAALAIAIRTGRSAEWKALAERAAQLTPQLPPLLEAALLVLQERDEEARELVDAALASEQPPDARWSLLSHALFSASGAAAPPNGFPMAIDPRLGRLAASEVHALTQRFPPSDDPRATAAWVAASATPEGRPLALSVLRTLAPPAGELPPVLHLWLVASFAERAGDHRTASVTVDTVLARAPDCEPAWDLREALDPELPLDPIAYGEFRGRRNRALGANEPWTMEQREDFCRWLASTGENAAAITAAEPGLGDAQPSAELTAILGRSLQALGRNREAVEHFARALSAKEPPRDVHGCIGDLVAAVDAIEASAEPLARGDAMRVLSNLAERYPRDPRIVLAMARIDLEIDRRNPVLGVQRAIARLEQFRAGWKGRGLDADEPGAAAAWIDFMARLDPARAKKLAEEELDLEPGSMPTWAAMARVHEALGDRARAVSELRLAARVVDHGEVSREILRISAVSDLEAVEIDAAVAKIQSLEGRPEPDAELRTLAARGFLNLGPRLSARAYEMSSAAYTDPLAKPGTRREAALISTLALLTRVGDTDPVRAAEYLEHAASESPARIQSDYLRALRGFTRDETKP